MSRHSVIRFPMLSFPPWVVLSAQGPPHPSFYWIMFTGGMHCTHQWPSIVWPVRMLCPQTPRHPEENEDFPIKVFFFLSYVLYRSIYGRRVPTGPRAIWRVSIVGLNRHYRLVILRYPLGGHRGGPHGYPRPSSSPSSYQTMLYTIFLLYPEYP